MTVCLEWPPEVVARLTEEALRKGLSLDAFLLETALEKVANGRPDSGERPEQRTREEAGRNISELRKGCVLGPDLTVGDLIEEGRRF